MPFEQARTLLCEGEALRRARRPAASRRPLRHALTIFSGLGARPWAARAMTELDATGARADEPERHERRPPWTPSARKNSKSPEPWGEDSTTSRPRRPCSSPARPWKLTSRAPTASSASGPARN